MRLNYHSDKFSNYLLTADVILEEGSSCALLQLQKYVCFFFIFYFLIQSSKDVNLSGLIYVKEPLRVKPC